MTTLVVKNNSVTIDGWSCHDNVNPPRDDLGNVHVLQKLTGWFGGIATRGAPIAQLVADGDFDGTTTRASRTVQVEGTLIAPDRPTLLRGMERLAGILAGSVRSAQLVVDEAEVDRQRAVWARLGGPTLVTRTGARTATFSLSLYCADPRRYGVTEWSVTLTPQTPGVGRSYDLIHPRVYGALGSGGLANIYNAGDARTYPVIIFTGPCTDPTINDDVNTMTLGMTLLAGETVIVDCGARTVLYGGASRRHFLTVNPSWLSLDGGSNMVHFTSFTGTGTATILWRDAWS